MSTSSASKSLLQPMNGALDHSLALRADDETVGAPTPVSSPPLPRRNLTQQHPPIPAFLFPTTTRDALPKLNRSAGLPLKIPSTALTLPPLDIGAMQLNSPSGSNPLADVLRERTQQRRAADDAALAALRVQVGQLEAALAAAEARRTQTVTDLQAQTSAAVTQLQSELRQAIQQDVAAVQERLGALEQRVTGLEVMWEKQVTQITSEMDQHVQQYQSQYRTLTEDLQQERQQQQEREQRLQQQMTEISETYLRKWQTERSERLTAVQNIQEGLEEQAADQRQQSARLHDQMTQDLQLLQNLMEQEQKERAQSDDEIVQALNRYTQYLQESLAAAVGGAIADD